MERKEVFICTDDNWYGNWDNNTVKLIYNGALYPVRHGRIILYRVSAWGNDDFGINKDFSSELEAKAVFEKLSKLEILNQKDLYDIGFETF